MKNETAITNSLREEVHPDLYFIIIITQQHAINSL